ncbi:hypothetical protein GYA25_02895 [Candidatus Woesearchaeota archaeon]|nr:hypothetical protein [Candidatus Woesearchaeota archaeon]
MENKKSSNFHVDPYTPKESVRKYKEKKTIYMGDNLILSILAGAGLIGSVYFGNKILNNEVQQISDLEKMLSELGVVGAGVTCLTAGTYSISQFIQGIKDKYDIIKSKDLSIKNKPNDFKSKLNKTYKN